MDYLSRRKRWRSPKRAGSPDPHQILGRRFAVLGMAIAVCFLGLTAQLVRLQVVERDRYRRAATDNRQVLVAVPPARGLITDRAGRPVAVNSASFYAAVVPDQLPREREDEVYASLQALLGVPAFEIQQKVLDARRRSDLYTPIIVKGEIDYDTYQILGERAQDLPGVVAGYEPVRAYPYGRLLSQVLGYVGPVEPDELKALAAKGYQPADRIGKAGVETTYEGYLRGKPGREWKEVDASGRTLRSVGKEAPQAGYTLTLSIDAELQQAVAGILEQSVADLDSKKAVAVVMDVRTGELLAYVSLPTYDNNIFSRPIDEVQYDALTGSRDKPLLDHAIGERFAPGSTFKIVTGLAALQEKVATPNTVITSTGALLVPRDYDKSLTDTFVDWRTGLGPLNFYRGVAMSSDIYFYCLAGGNCPELKEGLGNERLARYARNFGFGSPTGVDLPGETDGLIGDAAWLKQTTAGTEAWFLGDTYYMGIGQGYIEATPLQVVRLAAAVANGGQLLRPKVVREIRDSDGRVIVPARTEVQRRIDVSDANLAIMREAMRQAVADGTASTAQVPGVQVAGKTGTAEFGTRIGAGGANGRYKEHGWFTGFAPFDNPEVAVVVFHDQGGGALTAAPTASRILKAYFDLKAKRGG